MKINEVILKSKKQKANKKPTIERKRPYPITTMFGMQSTQPSGLGIAVSFDA